MKEAIRDATITYAHVDISAEAHEVFLEATVDELLATNYASQGWEEKIGGIKRGDVSIQAYLNDTADPDKTIWDIEQAPIVIYPERPPVPGNLGWFLNGFRTRQNRKYQVGQIAAIDLGVTNTSGPVLRGIALYHADDIDEYFSGGAFQGTAFNHGAVGATERAYAALIVRQIEGTGATLDVKVQSDTVGFPSATDRITFAQVTPLSALTTRYQVLSVAGAITDTYWRGDFAVGGTGVAIDLTLFFAIY